MSGQPSGIWYCREHAGIKNEDSSGDCDFADLDNEPCGRWVELVIPDEDGES